MKTTYKKTADRVRTTLRAWTDAAELYAARAAAEQTAAKQAAAVNLYWTLFSTRPLSGKAAAESAAAIDRLLTAAENREFAAAAAESAAAEKARRAAAAESAEQTAARKAAEKKTAENRRRRLLRKKARDTKQAAAMNEIDVALGKMPDVTPPPEQAAAVNENARAEHVARLQAAAAADKVQTEKRREQWARAIRAAAAAYSFARLPVDSAAAAAVYITLKHITRRDSVSGNAIKQAATWRRDLTAARAADFTRRALQERMSAAAAHESAARDSAAVIIAAAPVDDLTARAAAEQAARAYTDAARRYHAIYTETVKRYNALCTDTFGIGADLWQTAAAAILYYTERGLTVADIDYTTTGRPFCVWTRIASIIQQYIRAQKTAPSTPRTGDLTARAKGNDRPRRAHVTEHAAARAERSGKLAAALATLSPRDYEILTDRAAGIPAAVIADRLGLTPQHVNRLYNAARAAMRDKLSAAR